MERSGGGNFFANDDYRDAYLNMTQGMLAQGPECDDAAVNTVQHLLHEAKFLYTELSVSGLFEPHLHVGIAEFVGVDAIRAYVTHLHQ